MVAVPNVGLSRTLIDATLAKFPINRDPVILNVNE